MKIKVVVSITKRGQSYIEIYALHEVELKLVSIQIRSFQ